MATTATWVTVASLVLAPIAGFIGVLVGGWLATSREITARKLAYVEKQVRELYSPMLGIRREIRALSELRLSVEGAYEAAWQEDLQALEGAGPQIVGAAINSAEEQVDKDIKYNNNQLRVRLMPLYRRMQEIFRENMWLAEPETLTHWPTLVHYNDLWDRFLAGASDPRVHKKVAVSESELQSFYGHIEQTTDRLAAKIREGKP